MSELKKFNDFNANGVSGRDSHIYTRSDFRPRSDVVHFKAGQNCGEAQILIDTSGSISRGGITVSSGRT